MLDPCPSPAAAPNPAAEAAEATGAQALHTRLRALVRAERRVMRELALGLAAMDRERLYRALGYAGLVEYAEQALDLGPSMARQLARLGRRLPELPAIDAAFAAGALGWTKARTLSQVATPDTEAAWLARALQVSSRELEEQACRAALGDAPPEEEPFMEPPRHLWARFRLDPFHFERLMQALAEARHHLGDLDLSASQLLLFLAEEWLQRQAEGAGQADPEVEAAGGPSADAAQVCQAAPTTPRRAPAHEPAAHVCHAEAPAEPAPASAPIAHRILVHRCPDCARAWSEGRAGPMELDPRDHALCSCDAEEVAADPGAGTPGHLSRTVPPAVRRLVLVRDGGRCQVPGCRNRRHVEVHHLLPRSEGGGHSPENLVTLCSCHHDMVHRGVIRLGRGPAGALRCERGLGEPLGVLVNIHGERAELEQGNLQAFEGPPGSWPCIAGYWGDVRPPEGPPPRCRQQVRVGDEVGMAPRWMARAVRC